MPIATERMEFTLTKQMTIVIPAGEDIFDYFRSYDGLFDQLDDCETCAYEAELNGESVDENFIENLLS